ncbi:MAG: NAD(P)/FAD-dependent oxidoreductase [Bacteroidia bacterium]|nr:NAD(P)/FAD-dependent oxidoreductase [Bacteroidia bacterium]
MQQSVVIVIGGGASGFFAAINTAQNFPEAKVIILEKSNKILSKVKVSGGGRCNVTHHCFDNTELVKNFPRGHKELRQVFAQFSVQDTIEWFLKRGLKLKVENDGRMFPTTNSSDSVIECFLMEVQKYHIDIYKNEEVISLTQQSPSYIEVKSTKQTYIANSVICSIGGHHQIHNYQFLQEIGHQIDNLIPSLFTLNLPQSPLKELMGLSVKQGTVKVIGTKHQYSGPILITHWGISGPAVLKLSAFAAKDFFDLNYNATIIINWTEHQIEDEIRTHIEKLRTSKMKIVNTPLFDIPKRLWEYLIARADIDIHKLWIELGNKQLNKLIQVIFNDQYDMRGKTTFKEEFVTAGGVNLKQVDFKTMQSKLMPGLFFCGEVLNIDGITGGFNFQNAWSTAWIASKNVLK